MPVYAIFILQRWRTKQETELMCPEGTERIMKTRTRSGINNIIATFEVWFLKRCDTALRCMRWEVVKVVANRVGFVRKRSEEGDKRLGCIEWILRRRV